MPASIKALICITALGIGTSVSAQESEAEALRAEAEYLRARLDRVNAEIALSDHVKQDDRPVIASAKEDLRRASSDFDRAEDRLEWSTRMLKKGYVSQSSNVADRLSLDKARLDLEVTSAQLAELGEAAKRKAPRKLREAVVKARAKESERKAAYDKLLPNRDKSS